MGGPKDYTKQSKSERQIAYGITYMWNLTHDTNEYLQKRNRLTDIESRLVGCLGEGMSLGLAETNCSI